MRFIEFHKRTNGNIRKSEILEKVYTTFKNDNSTSISKKSHDELAWIDNNEVHSFIDFKYAFYLKNI